MTLAKIMEKKDLERIFDIYDIGIPAFAVTLSLKKSNHGLRIDDYKADISYRHLICRLSRYFFGRCKTYLRNVGFRDTGRLFGKPHIHALVENTGMLDISDFSDRLVHEWQRTSYGFEPVVAGFKNNGGGTTYKNTCIENVTNVGGWISYSTKYNLDLDRVINIASSFRKV